MGRLFWLNSFCYLLYGLGVLVLEPTANESLVSRIGFSLIVLTILFPLTGINLTAIIEKISQEQFDGLETLSISIISSLLFVPFLLSLEYSSLHWLFPTLPLFNALIIFFLAFAFAPHCLDIPFKNPKGYDLSRLVFGGALGIYVGLSLLITTAYYFLPDSDPYYWLLKIQQELSAGSISPLHLYRPLFSSLAYIFHETAGVDLYAFFKYSLPLFFTAILLPTSLMARREKDLLHQLIILLSPLTCASMILYFELPIPQSIVNTSLVFFVFFILYSWITGKKVFYFLAGALMGITYFYHEIALLFLAPWFIVTLFYYRRSCIALLAKNKVSAILLILFALFNGQTYLRAAFGFFKNWFVRISPTITDWHTNWSFPMSYTTIDGRVAGWGSWLGVIQFYTFYVGPVIALLLLLFLRFLLSSHDRKILWHTWFKKVEFLSLASIFLLFFSLAEIFPRVFNVALLPERSWGFAGLIFISLIPLLFHSDLWRKKWLSSLLLLAIGVSCGTALYVNYLKKDLITPAQLTSAEWIKLKLPQNKIVFLYNNWSVLRAYSQSRVVDIPDPHFYTDIAIFDTALSTLVGDRSPIPESRYVHFLQQTDVTLRGLPARVIPENKAEIIHDLQLLSDQSLAMRQTLENVNEPRFTAPMSPIYIYYTKPSQKNLYANRPYFNKSDTVSAFVFDTYPKRFERIYTAPNDEVIIWQYHP